MPPLTLGPSCPYDASVRLLPFLVLIAAFLVPDEATAWKLEGTNDPSKYLGVLKLCIGSAGTALLAWGLVLRLRGREDSLQRTRHALLIALGALAAAGWFNFFQFHGGVFVHTSRWGSQ